MSTEFESRRDWRRNRRNHEGGRVLTGFFLLVCGAALFLKNMNVGIPDWFFSWQTFLIALGFYFGVKHHFRGPLWLVLIVIGGISLQDELFPFANLREFTWPAVLVIIGLFFILRPKRRVWADDTVVAEPFSNFDTAPAQTINGDSIDIVSIFGSVKKVVVSKNFRGGETVSFLGGSEINLSQADIQGKVKLEATNVFGGTKLIVPSNWDVQSEMVAIFGGVEDKRDLKGGIADPNKVLVIDGTSIFGGLEIRSH
jgi:predicted membrane protein